MISSDQKDLNTGGESVGRYQLTLGAMFLLGAGFHCIDFLGVKFTLLWGTGLFFVWTTSIAIILWIQYLKRQNILKSLI